jgi:uncharacterized protein DUF2569
MQGVLEVERLKGVRGWLLLPPVIAAVAVLRIVHAYGVVAAERAGTGPLLWAVIAANIPVVAFGVLAIVALLQRRKIARPLMIAFFALAAVLGAAGYIVIPASDALDITLRLRFIAVPLALIVYFLVSRRVKATLTN